MTTIESQEHPQRWTQGSRFALPLHVVKPFLGPLAVTLLVMVGCALLQSDLKVVLEVGLAAVVCVGPVCAFLRD